MNKYKYAKYDRTNDEIVFLDDIISTQDLATYSELMDFICVGQIEELSEETIVKDGLVIYYNDTMEMDFIRN